MIQYFTELSFDKKPHLKCSAKGKSHVLKKRKKKSMHLKTITFCYIGDRISIKIIQMMLSKGLSILLLQKISTFPLLKINLGICLAPN